MCPPPLPVPALPPEHSQSVSLTTTTTMILSSSPSQYHHTRAITRPHSCSHSQMSTRTISATMMTTLLSPSAVHDNNIITLMFGPRTCHVSPHLQAQLSIHNLLLYLIPLSWNHPGQCHSLMPLILFLWGGRFRAELWSSFKKGTEAFSVGNIEERNEGWRKGPKGKGRIAWEGRTRDERKLGLEVNFFLFSW